MERFTRRGILALSGGAGLTLAAPRMVRSAAAYPEKNITFIIPYGPGGGFDSFVRVIAPAMEKYLPHPVNVVPLNIATGGGGRAMIQLTRAPPDGYMLAAFSIPGALILQEQQGARDFDLTQFTWLGSLGPGETYALGVATNSPIQSIADLRALSRTRPVKFTCTGPDGTSYMATVISAYLLQIDASYITGYGGSNEYIIAAIRGDGDATVAALSTLKQFQGERGIRILATFEEHGTVAGALDATTLGQPELSQITLERMVAAPPNLPADIATILTQVLDAAVRDPEVVAWAARASIPWMPHPPGQSDAIFRASAAFFEKWKTQLTGA